MCNYLVKGGKVCSKAKTKDRCSNHPLSEFKAHMTNPIEVETSIIKLLETGYEEQVNCPCGSTMLRWNYARHCDVKKHKYWISTMPDHVRSLIDNEAFFNLGEMYKSDKGFGFLKIM